MPLSFFEKFALAAHPDPGRANQNRTSECRLAGRSGNRPPRLLSGQRILAQTICRANRPESGLAAIPFIQQSADTGKDRHIDLRLGVPAPNGLAGKEKGRRV
jgi:hypothetical protein